MEIRFSRHARRRMRLYKISEEIVNDLLNNISGQGKQVIIQPVEGFVYPLKVVFEIKKDSIVVITVYPLKRGLK